MAQPAIHELRFMMRFIKNSLKIGGWIFVIVGAIDLAASLFFYVHARNFVKSASRAEGTITKFVEEKDSDSDAVIYYPVYTFHDSQGQDHEITSSSGSSLSGYKVGQTVAVLYSPDQPEKAKLDGFFDIWFLTVLLVGSGTFGLLVGSGMLGVRRLLEKQKPPAAI
jgi:hypothetical protein